jgi:hypothetical protein
MDPTCSVTRWRCCGCERGEFSACSPPPNSTPSPPSTNESCVTSPRKPSPKNPLPTSPRSRTERLTGPRSTNRGGHTARTRPQHSSTLPGPARHASKRVDQAPAVLVSFRNQCRIWISPTAASVPSGPHPIGMRTHRTPSYGCLEHRTSPQPEPSRTADTCALAADQPQSLSVIGTLTR